MPLILASEFSDSFDKTQKLLGPDVNKKTVTIIPTAAHGEGWEPNPETNIHPFEKLGIKTTIFDIKGKSPDNVYKQIMSSDIIYVCGGNTFYLLKYMNDCNFKNALMAFLENDGIYIGSSAGAIVMSPDISFITEMDDPSVINLNDNNGLSMIDFYFLPHLDHNELGVAAHKIIKQYQRQKETLVALKDNQALYIKDNIVRYI